MNTEIEASLLSQLWKAGRPMTRGELRWSLRAGDRKIREAVAALQRGGHPIISLEKGYKFGSADEVEVYIAREKKRALAILSKIRHLCPAADRAVQQLNLF